MRDNGRVFLDAPLASSALFRHIPRMDGTARLAAAPTIDVGVEGPVLFEVWVFRDARLPIRASCPNGPTSHRKGVHVLLLVVGPPRRGGGVL